MSRGLMITTGIIGIIAAIVVLSSVFVVHQTEQVLILRFGNPVRVINAGLGEEQSPGLKLKIPFVETALVFDKRVLDFDADAKEVPTKDQKQLLVDTFARFRITEPLAFYKTVTDERGARLRLSNLIEASMREVMGNVNLSQVLTEQRSDLMTKIASIVNKDAASFGINVIDVRMKRVDLPQENSQAIFRRMQTQREQEARKIRAEGEKDAAIIKADADKNARVIVAEAKKTAEILRGEGEGQAQAIYNGAYGRDPTFFDFYRSMQAYSKGLGGDSTTYVGPTDSEFFRFFGETAGPMQR